MNNKVCHIISGYYRNDPRIFQRQCKSLVNSGFSVSILTNDNEPDEVLEGIEINSCGIYWRNRIKVLLFAKYQFLKKALAIDSDVYQLHSPELLSLGLALKKYGKIVVYDAHEDLPRHILEKEWIPKIFRKPIAFLVEIYMRRPLKKFNAIVSPHPHVVDDLNRINKNVCLITNFAKTATTSNFDLASYLKREESICYTGTVYLHSNQELILEAIADINNIKYNIAGFFQDDHYKALSKRRGFEKIHFIGRIPWNQLNDFYCNSQIGLVIIDYKQNLGGKRGTFAVNKMFEYMEAGLPIICSDYDLWIEIVEKHECGICVEPGNVEQIINAITFLLDNPDKAYQMGQNGRRAVLEEYNWATQELVYVDLFKNLISSIKP